MSTHAPSPIAHHIDDDILLDYASGSLAEGWSIAVATHLAFCPACRARLGVMEKAGGALLETIAPDPLDPRSWAALRARIASAPEIERTERAPAKPDTPPVIPEPLRSYVGSDFDAIKWRSMPGARHLGIPTRDKRTRVRLLRIPAGQPVPEHTHRGREMTLVLSGAFSDGQGTFRRGDIEIADETLTHEPVATQDGECICLTVTDAPLKFKSWIVRLFQPLLGI